MYRKEDIIVVDYTHILVATDFSPVAEKAARRASELAMLTGGRLTLLHVLEHFPEDIPNYSIAPEDVDPEQFYTEKARAGLEELRSNLGSKGGVTAVEIIVSTDVDVVVSSYSAGREISGYASQHNMDLIVMGIHGKRGFLGIAGSVATNVLHTASVDVLAVRL